jgi:hypothetical protein
MIDEARPIAACHQPNFFPWLGYFHKLRWSDTFVFLDDVLLQKTRGSVTNRVAVGIGGKQEWMSAPLDRSYSGNLEIRSVRFAPEDRWRDRFVATLKMHYAKAPHYRELEEPIVALVKNPEPMLGAYNMHAIEALATMLGLRAALVRSSAREVAATGTRRLAELVSRVGARTYLAGGGAKAYQQDEIFAERSIGVLYQGFVPPTYPRGNEPALPGLSVLDALLWIGVDGTRALLDSAPAPAPAEEGAP